MASPPDESDTHSLSFTDAMRARRVGGAFCSIVRTALPPASRIVCVGKTSIAWMFESRVAANALPEFGDSPSVASSIGSNDGRVLVAVERFLLQCQLAVRAAEHERADRPRGRRRCRARSGSWRSCGDDHGVMTMVPHTSSPTARVGLEVRRLLGLADHLECPRVAHVQRGDQRDDREARGERAQHDRA